MPKQDDQKAAQAAERLARLQDLWWRRDSLDAAEWPELYTMVYHTLIPPARRYIDLLAKLPESAEDYVQHFFEDRVFRATFSPKYTPKTIYPGALRTFFKNYLLDRLDEVKRHPEPMEPEADVEGQEIDLLEHLSPKRHHPQWQPLEEDRWLLWEAGLDEATVMIAASDFYRRLTPDEQTIFRENCIAGKKLSTLTSTILNVYAIASRLGLSVNRQRIKDFSRQTKIGQWLTQPPDADPPGLGLALHIENWDLIFIVLQILRVTALEEGSTGQPPAPTSGAAPALPDHSL